MQATTLRTRRFAAALLLSPIAAAMVATPAVAQQAATKLREPDVIYVPTPQEVVDAMLVLANVTAKDVVYDLGSGDALGQDAGQLF